VVDTANSFTQLGKIIILCLIQIGGLGIMTFTGFFSYIFTSSSSFHGRLLLKDIFSSQSIGNLFKILTKIILFTFLTELVGALLIYSSLYENVPDKIFFSLFHAVSAFCNAGFSSISGGMYSIEIRDNYSLQLTVASLIILGGIGFPVLLKVYSYVKHLLLVLIKKIGRKRLPVIKEKLDVGSKIALGTTLFLIVGGTLLYYFFEKDNGLYGMSNFRMGLTAFFNSITARTAGFNINDISHYGYPAVFLTILLMWIGASPSSTGGGIKTTTFAIALKAAWNNIRGKQVLEISNREISKATISRVLTIIILSFAIIGTGFFCLLFSEPEKNPVHLLYESVSAFSTVGLSIANTSTFSQNGKIILMLLMFIGRVGPLTFMAGFLISYKKKYHKYPETEIAIN
jgi:trk system potassium uptake protein